MVTFSLKEREKNMNKKSSDKNYQHKLQKL